MITSKTKKIGILGWPLGHSLSPLMHNAAFTALNLDYVYVPLPVQPENLAQAVAGLKAMDFTGANVTIPHKVAIMSYLDEIDLSAQLVGAVNTILIKEGKCIGYNTDAQGFIQSLTRNNVTIMDKKAVIMGAGGAARAVASGLIQNGIQQITIGTRNPLKAQEFTCLFPNFKNLLGCNWRDSTFTNQVKECDILINSTPIGMSANEKEELPILWENVNKDAAICDLIYNPPMTAFLNAAQIRGYRTINGAGMLVEQGALAFELWTDKQAPRTIMSKIVLKYM
ncbi:shikimate dehydrogenase [Pelosinus sp. IPA-1]|uniref:shikimate dehydrogenase n=1 Tax=Pelosinus sp. IPA-1 TaxID=3029569 RepID=UPI0024362443|nr:shikimate dehydrogenase [Pelosinus sp. IPA-1]GMA99454.1 shikimate dehydrogenase [Pelosinus sp. IPA-1]